MFMIAHHTEKFKLVFKEGLRISRNKAADVVVDLLKDETPVHEGETSLDEDSKAMICILRCLWVISKLLSDVWHQHIHNSFHCMMIGCRESLVSQYLNFGVLYQMLSHGFYQNIKEKP